MRIYNYILGINLVIMLTGCAVQKEPVTFFSNKKPARELILSGQYLWHYNPETKRTILLPIQ